MTKIGSINFATSVDTAELKAALTDLQEAVQNLDAKLDALNKVEVPLTMGPLTMANKPSPSYRAADPEASEM